MKFGPINKVLRVKNIKTVMCGSGLKILVIKSVSQKRAELKALFCCIWDNNIEFLTSMAGFSSLALEILKIELF